MDQRFNLIRVLALGLYLVNPACSWAMGHVPAESSHGQGFLIGRQAVGGVLPQSDGTSQNLMNAYSGKKAVLVFWATWCPHCYEELGNINQVSADLQSKGIKLILVDLGDSQEDVKAYLTRRGINLTSFIDQEDSLQDSYRLSGVPTMLFIDEHGIIARVTHQLPSDYAHYFIRS